MGHPVEIHEQFILKSDCDATGEDLNVDLGEPLRVGGQARPGARGEVQEEDGRGQLPHLHQECPRECLPRGKSDFYMFKLDYTCDVFI